MMNNNSDGLRFMKMHGLGNDFVVLDLRDGGAPPSPQVVARIADRHCGVGFDQLATVAWDDQADVRLVFWNADGSLSSACGNATRCIARFVMDETGQDRLSLRTDHGMLYAEDAGNGLTRVNMGPPVLEWQKIPLTHEVDIDHLPIEGDPVATGMGNPHLTFFVEDAEAVDLDSFGPEHEHHPLYPERTNVEVVQVLARDEIRLRIWERGTGPTLASGSCSCAAAVAAARRGLTDRRVKVNVPGGVLMIDWREDGVWMEGPTAYVFDGRADATMVGIMSTPVFSTLGCRLNAYETEAMREMAEDAGLSGAVVVNTCAVTAEAVRKARQEIRRLARENPGAPVIVTGCAAQTEPETFAAMPEVTKVIGNHEKMQPETWQSLHAPDLIGETEKVRVDDIMSVKETAGHLIDGFGRHRAYVQVQNGCDHRCTFCIIPFGRGNSRSVPAGVVVEQIKRLVGRGFNEVVLTGVDLTSWGADLPGQPRLGDLVMRILRLIPDLPRLRISSIDSIEADENLMLAIGSEPRLMPHLHLSLQAGDDMILKRMKRRHLRDDAIRFCEDARKLRPDLVFGADIIAGFPTETEQMFENSLKLVEDCGLTFLHVFPYSARKGTPAARMPAVKGPVIRERAGRLRQAGDAALRRHLEAQKGQVHRVLTEGPRLGRTEQFTEVEFSTDQPEGSLMDVTIAGHDGLRLTV